MNKGVYRYLFWGMIYIFLNINIYFLNVLPNFIGYIYVFYALIKLSQQKEFFNKAKIPTVILIVLGITDILEKNYLYRLVELQDLRLLLEFLTSLESVLFLYVLYVLCEGISTIAKDQGFSDIANSIKRMFKIFLYFLY
ncbi:hypothetical protein PL321_17965 [Caloramator sp. mosi_1]|uniref:hypothetical protein n=1 Tax=Caloramator sp. mosi_1 TaxID=3023090 RepID=UPI00235F4796|nr:hypothetical protein [Caloramator sp. mosi_1]WDC84127.1 hypothetical protein PL321_17965 [Caloramator sp. mosi_1]